MDGREISQMYYHQAMVVTDEEPVILKGEYDPNQTWLSFMRGTIFKKIVTQVNSSPRKKIHNHLHATCTGDDRQPYVYERGVDQRVIPYSEFRRVSNKQFATIRDAGFPGWDRTQEGEVCTAVYPSFKRPEVLVWCEENCVGRYSVKQTIAYFSSIRDAALARLWFQE